MQAKLISLNPDVMSGTPSFVGTSILAQNLSDYLDGSSTLGELLEDFLSVNRSTAVAVLEAAKERLISDAHIV
jgi:uncharacterized protein (DUF433 family)